MHSLLGVLMVGFGNGAVVWAEQTVPSGLTALLIAVTPFWMLGIQRLTGHGSRLLLRQRAGIIGGFIGVALLVWPQVESKSGPAFLWGVVATQFAAAGWSLGSNLSRQRHVNEHVLAASALQMVFGGAFLLGLSLVTREPWMLAVSTQSLVAFLYLVLVGSIVAYSSYAYALQHLPLSTVSLYAYVNPVIAVALGTVFLSEPLQWRLIVASVVVLGSVVAVRK
jgi:drug/metabolite transporter (DMT)-like permease